jgi:acyl-CoA reductase-like NAD-dependent aldehyde dehydrogenase
VSGHNRIAGRTSAAGTGRFHPTDPRTGQPMADSYPEATAEEITAAVDAALHAVPMLRAVPSPDRGAVLHRLADQLRRHADRLVALADIETGLGREHLGRELEESCRRMHRLGDRVGRGEDVGAAIHTRGDGGADTRIHWVGMGPVAVLGDAVSPFVCGVPGGDTLTALAAGCPVIAKANALHPGTAEACAAIIDGVVAAVGWPAGTHALLHGRRPAVAEDLLAAQGLAAAGYTGAPAFGRTLFDLAMARPEPIPFHATFGGLNPVVVTSAALRTSRDRVAGELVDAVIEAAGQSLARPGLVVVPADVEGEWFLDAIARRFRGAPALPMVSGRAQGAFAQTVTQQSATAGVTTIVAPVVDARQGYLQQPVLLSVGADDFLANPLLSEECSGPLLLAVRCTAERLPELLAELPGSLTAALYTGDPATDRDAAAALPALTAFAGQVRVDAPPHLQGPPAVSPPAGPWPSASEPPWSSSESDVIRRWQRPVTFHGVPEALLPPPVRDDNPWGIRRTVDGELTDGPVSERPVDAPHLR